MKMFKLALLATLGSMNASASDMDALTVNDTSVPVQLKADELRLVQSQLPQDWMKASNNLIPTSAPNCKLFFEHCRNGHGPGIFEYMDGKSIAILTQAVTPSLKPDYRFTFMSHMKRNLFSFYSPCSLEESKRVLRSYVYASFPKKSLDTIFHEGFNFTQHEATLRAFFENNRQGRNGFGMRENLIDHLLTTRSGAKSMGLFFETLDFEQKEQFLKSSLLNPKRLRGFKDNTDILCGFPELQAQVIQHNAWLDLNSKMDKRKLCCYVRNLGRQEKDQRLFISRMILRNRTGMNFDEVSAILNGLKLVNADQSREIFFSIAKDSTGDVHQQACAMRLYIHNQGQELEDKNREVIIGICESIVRDPNADPTRQLYALQRLVDMDPVAQMLLKVQELSTKIWEYQYVALPIEVRAHIHANAKKVFSSFHTADVEALCSHLVQDPNETCTPFLERVILDLKTVSQAARKETMKRANFRMRIVLQNPRALQELMGPIKVETDTWKLRLAKDLFPCNPLAAEFLLLDIVQHPNHTCTLQSSVSEKEKAAFLLKMFSRPQAARKAYTLVADNPEESRGDRRHAQNWLEAQKAVSLLKSSSSLDHTLNLELIYLLDGFQFSKNHTPLWSKIFLHTQNQAQKQIAKDKLQLLKPDTFTDAWFLGHQH